MKDISELESMTKSEIEEYGSTLGIDLDARHTKTNMINELIAFVENAGNLTGGATEEIEEVDDVVSEKTEEQPEEEIVEPHADANPLKKHVDVRKARRKRYCAV